MDIVFRADAGVEIGIGHLMRCLTLADGLAARGHESRFICREHPGQAANQIASRGYRVDVLPSRPAVGGGWLGASEADDAAESLARLDGQHPDWVVTDHYGIGQQWERSYRNMGSRVLAIDDLADRVHDCDILLDQTLGRSSADYAGLIPAAASTLVGASFALLRPEFAQLRSGQPRKVSPSIERLLLSLGGADAANLTALAIEAIDRCAWPMPIAIDIVLGSASPWVEVVRARAARSPYAARVLVDVRDMADLMLAADLAIGTAGTTSWERCCLALPSILIVAAENQKQIAEALAAAGAAATLPVSAQLVERLTAVLEAIASAPSARATMSERAGAVTDGNGCNHVIEVMEALP